MASMMMKKATISQKPMVKPVDQGGVQPQRGHFTASVLMGVAHSWQAIIDIKSPFC